jgi:excisionase family DNA binding protein
MMVTLNIGGTGMPKTAIPTDDVAVMTVPEAGRRLGLSRLGAYQAAKRGDIPTLRIGRLLKVPKVAFDRMLEQVGRAAAPSKVA